MLLTISTVTQLNNLMYVKFKTATYVTEMYVHDQQTQTLIRKVHSYCSDVLRLLQIAIRNYNIWFIKLAKVSKLVHPYSKLHKKNDFHAMT